MYPASKRRDRQGLSQRRVVKRMKAYGVRSYIPRRNKRRRNWAGKPTEQQAVYANRRGAGRVRKSLLRRRGELVERSFAHCYETAECGAAICRARKHSETATGPRGAFNLSLILRKLLERHAAGAENLAGQLFRNSRAFCWSGKAFRGSAALSRRWPADGTIVPCAHLITARIFVVLPRAARSKLGNFDSSICAQLISPPSPPFATTGVSSLPLFECASSLRVRLGAALAEVSDVEMFRFQRPLPRRGRNSCTCSTSRPMLHCSELLFEHSRRGAAYVESRKEKW